MKHIYIQEKLILQLIFNLGLALTDSHTNQSRLRRTSSRPGQGQCFESSYIRKLSHETIRILNCALSLVSSQFDRRFRRFIKSRVMGKLPGCERELAINLPGCFRLLFLLSFISKTKNAQLKNPTDLLHKNLMKPLKVASIESSYDRNQRSVRSKQRLFRSKSK